MSLIKLKSIKSLSSSRKQIVLLYCSTIIGVFIGVLISILNTRNLSPSDYGDVRYINNIIGLLSGLFLFGYFVSGCRLLAVAKSKDEARQIKGAMLTVLLFTVFLMMISMALSGCYFYYVLHKPYAYLFFVAIPFCGSTILLNYINTSSQGDNSIGLIAKARLMPGLLYLIFGFWIYSCYGATSSRMIILQNGIYFIVLLILIILNKPSFKNLKKSMIKLNAENRQYGKQVYYGSLANVSVQYIAGVMLGLMALDNTDVGFYTLALTITMPLTMLPNVIGTTKFKDFASKDRINKKLIQYTFILTGGTFICFVFLIYPVVDFLYDDSYRTVASYACFLALGSSFHGLGDMFNRFLGAHSMGKSLRNGAWASGVVSIIGFTVGIYFWGITAAITTRILGSLTYFLFMVYYYLKFIKTYKCNNY